MYAAQRKGKPSPAINEGFSMRNETVEQPPAGRPVEPIVGRLRDRLPSLKCEDITEDDLEAVEDLIGMGRGAWDMVDHRELVLACVKVVCGKPT